MRDIDETLLKKLEQASTSMAIFVLIETKDGERIRFNSSNRDVYTYFDLDQNINPKRPDYVIYKGGGYTPSIFSTDETNSVQKMDISGLLSSIHDEVEDNNSFKYELAMNNYYQGAKVFIAMADYENPHREQFYINNYYTAINHIKIARANIGNITIKDLQKIEIELRGFNQKLNNPINTSYSRSCRAKLFDDKCGLNQDNYVSMAMIYEVNDNLTFTIPKIEGTTTQYYNAGSLTMTSGENIGQKGVIRSCKEIDIEGQLYYKIELRKGLTYKPSEGDSLNIYPGCNKTVDNCKLFNNIDNFRGEPYIPGDDVFKIQGIGNQS